MLDDWMAERLDAWSGRASWVALSDELGRSMYVLQRV